MSDKALIILESPHKIKTLKKILKNGYDFFATCGHLMHIDGLENITYNEEQGKIDVRYSILPHQKKRVSQLKKIFPTYESIILATDADNEGESISYQVCKILKIKYELVRRVIFNDITETTVSKAMLAPWASLDINAVLAQKARQVIDLLIGYTTTPIIRSKLDNDAIISCGRCQTPVLNLIHNEYNKQPSTENEKHIYIELNGYDFKCKSDIDLNIGFNHQFYITKQDVKNVNITPPSPLNTSNLIQLAAKQLGWSPDKTMKTAQTLYESGLITYHRTDSNHYSTEFKKSIINTEAYAHEAIRHTLVEFTDFAKHSGEARLYNLIKKISTQSCLPTGIDEIITFIATSTDNTITAEYKHCRIKILGWRDNSQENTFIPFFNKELTKPKQIRLVPVIHNSIGLETHSLIQLLTQHHIGRPSTYASIIDKLFSKNLIEEIKEDLYYNTVKEEIINNKGIEIKEHKQILHKKGSLKATYLGEQILNIAHNLNLFSNDSLFELKFSSNIEQLLTQINEYNWTDICFIVKKKLEKLETLEPVHNLIQENYIVKKGKYGLYTVVNNKIINLSCYGNREASSISNQEVKKVLENTRILPNNLELKYGKFGYFLSKDGKNVSLKYFNNDVTNCDIQELIDWFDNH